ncbi:Ketosynthase (fragment) [Parafrankia sp. Ea1.12]
MSPGRRRPRGRSRSPDPGIGPFLGRADRRLDEIRTLRTGSVSSPGPAVRPGRVAGRRVR